MEQEHASKTVTRVPWNKGQAGRREAALAPEPRLVDPDQAPNRGQEERPSSLQPGDRQQASWL